MNALSKKSISYNSLTFLCTTNAGITNAIDLVIALDATNGAETIVAMKDLLKSLSKSYQLSRTGTNIGLISYGTRAREMLSLRSGKDVSTVMQAIDEIRQEDGPRNLQGAIAAAYNMLTPKYQEEKRNANKQLVLVVNGGNADMRGVDFLSRRLKQERIRPIIVAVNVTNAQILRPLAHDSNDVIEVNDPRSIGSALGKIEERSGKNAGKSD